MGITCDPEKNRCRGKEQIISRDGAPVTVMVVPTNEELMIAQDTMELVLDQEEALFIDHFAKKTGTPQRPGFLTCQQVQPCAAGRRSLYQLWADRMTFL